jgi:hypothetical protein
VVQVELSEAAVEDLDRVIPRTAFPGNTKASLKRSLRPLERFPLLGAALDGR